MAEHVAYVDDASELAELVRREYGSLLPAAEPRESQQDRERRQEKTKYVLETDVMPLVNSARVEAHRPKLSTDDEDTVIELVLSAMFLLPHIMGILEREPLAEDLTILGAGAVRVDLADGTVREYPPVVTEDRALERVIADVAEANHRPFSFENPFVDVALSPRLRFHGQGFDVVAKPAIFVRVHRVLGVSIDELYESGTMSSGLAYLLGTVVPSARLKVAVTGEMGSGKTTLLRSILLAYPELTRATLIETDPELQIASLGRPWAHEMQARIAVTTNTRGIDCADLMAPALRTSSQVTVIGEVRGGEGAPAVRAANIGQGTLVTVHGDTAEAGLEQLVDRVCDDGTTREIARRMVYKSFDLVVHMAKTPNRDRWVAEVIHPLMEGDQPKIHTLYEPSPAAPDARARAAGPVWPELLSQKIQMAMTDFDPYAARDDTYQPLHRAQAPASEPARAEPALPNGHRPVAR